VDFSLLPEAYCFFVFVFFQFLEYTQLIFLHGSYKTHCSLCLDASHLPSRLPPPPLLLPSINISQECPHGRHPLGQPLHGSWVLCIWSVTILVLTCLLVL
jgi:hypothetical protein